MRFIIFKPFINYIFRNLFQLDNFSKANTLITKGKQCPFYNCSMKAFSNISTHFTARHRKLKEKEIYKNSVLLKYSNIYKKTKTFTQKLKPNNDFYEKVHPEYYEKLSQKSLNPFRRWFHKKRYEILNNLVKESYQEGKIIVDMGCGSSTWNQNKLPVIGIDINKTMLEHAKQTEKLKDYICTDLENTTLPNSFADIVILSEIIEHVENPKKVLEEAARIAKPNAKIIITVPYDSLLSLWYPLFNAQCLFYGYILNKPFYKDFGGHIHHFTPKKIKKTLEETNLKVLKQFHNKRLTIYNICIK